MWAVMIVVVGGGDHALDREYIFIKMIIIIIIIS